MYDQKEKQKLRSKVKRKNKRIFKNLSRENALSTDTRDYLIHVLERLKTPFDDDEEKGKQQCYHCAGFPNIHRNLFIRPPSLLQFWIF